MALEWCSLEIATEGEMRKSILEAAIAEGVTTNQVSVVNETLSLMKMLLAATDDLLHFKTAPPMMLNVRNGEIWLGEKTFDFRPHDPKSGARHVLPVDYDEDAKAPEFHRTLKAIFKGAKDEVGLRKFMGEVFGHAIQPRRQIALILMLFGPWRANGKTKLIELLTKLLGPGQVYSGRMEDLEGGRFTFGALFGKFLFVDDDIKSGVKLPDGVLKKISEEKLVTGEQKFKPHFEFVCRTIPVLLCNNIPLSQT